MNCSKKTPVSAFLLTCFFSAVFLFLVSAKAYCCQYTIRDPDNSDILVTVSVTQDLGKNWVHTDDEGKEHHLVALSMGAMPVTVRVSAVYQGSNEGTVTQCLPNDAGADFSNNWVENDSSSSTLTVLKEDLLPTDDNNYRTDIRINFGFFVHYNETIDGQTSSGTAAFKGELILSPLLAVGASIDRFSSQLLVGVYEITGFDGVSPLRTQLGNNKVTVYFGSSGQFTLGFDKQDEEGTYYFNIVAPLSSDFDSAGYMHDVITINANADEALGVIDFNAPLGFAVAAGKSGISRLLAREDVLMDPRDITTGEVLLPGDTIGVISGELLLRFANGESALITSTTPTRIVLGSNGVASERSYISFWVENYSYDIQHDPRKYARMSLFMLSGKGMSSALPAGTHWVYKMGASALGKYILQLIAGPQALNKARNKLLSTSEKSSESSGGGRTIVNIFPGGTIMFHPLQGQALLDYGSNKTTLAANSLTMGDLEASVPFISRPGGDGYSLTNVAYGFSAHWFGSDGEIHTRTPTLGIGVARDPYTNESMINPDYIEVRLNGRLVPDAGIDPVDKTVRNIVVAPDAPLQNGSNTLEAWLEEANRHLRHKITGSVTVAADAFAAPPSKVTPLSHDSLTILRWSTPDYPDILGYEIARGETESGPFLLLNSTPCVQRTWLDDWHDNPPTNAYWYRVRTVYENGLTGSWSAPVQQQEAAWHDGYPPFTAPANFRASNVPAGLLIQFDDNMPDMVFWKLERGMSVTGPWEDVLHGRYLATSGYRDRDITPDTQYWYRVTAYSVLGDGPESRVIGPVSWDGRPVPPTGLTCYINKGVAELRWDPIKDDTVHSFRIYRDSGAGFQPVHFVPATTTVYQDHLRVTGTYDWLIKSVSADGRESLEGAQTNSGYLVSTKASGNIRLGVATEHQNNGERYATVPLYRTGGSSGPLLVVVNLNQASDTGPDIRGKLGGTILFANGETSKVLTTPLDPGYHLDHFMISATFGLNTASRGFPWPMFLPALTTIH